MLAYIKFFILYIELSLGEEEEDYNHPEETLKVTKV